MAQPQSPIIDLHMRCSVPTRGQGHRVCFGRQIRTPHCTGEELKETCFRGYLDRWAWVLGPNKGWEGLKVGYDANADRNQTGLPKMAIFCQR